MVLATLGLFFGACLILIILGAVLVKSLIKLASFLRMSEFFAAFILMAICTSLPELFVGITSALAGTPAFSLGNVIGSNIIDLTLVAGIAVALARGIRIESKIVRKQVFGMVILASLPMVLMFIGKELSRFDALILIGAFSIYFIKMITARDGHLHSKFNKAVKPWVGLGAFMLFAAAVVGLYFSASWVVKYGGLIAVELSLPPIMVGLFLVAFGTSLPELIFSVRAAMTRHGQLALGDIMGAVVMNSTIVLAVTALIHPITDSFVIFMSSAAFMVVVTFLFATFISSGRKLSWREGICLILFYVLFVIIELNLEQYFA